MRSVAKFTRLFRQILALDKFSFRHATIQKVSKYEDFSNEIEFQSLVEAASRLDYLPVDSKKHFITVLTYSFTVLGSSL